MTGSSNKFTTYSPYSGKEKVRIANGSLANISRTVSIECTPTINFALILHVPSFPINLLSVSSITKALNYKVKFFPTHCVFQKLKIGRMISSGRLQDSLYLLNDSNGFSNPKTLVRNSIRANQEII